MGLFEDSFSICALPFNHWVLPLPPNSALIAVCSVWVYVWRKQDIKSQNVLCSLFLSPRLALCISDFDPEALQMPRGWFCCGNRTVKRWDGGVPQWAVFVFCCCFVFLSLWVVLFPSQIPQTQKVSSPTSFSPVFFFFFLFLPTHSSFALLLRK